MFYLKGIQDVGVFVSTVFSILIFLCVMGILHLYFLDVFLFFCVLLCEMYVCRF